MLRVVPENADSRFAFQIITSHTLKTECQQQKQYFSPTKYKILAESTVELTTVESPDSRLTF